MLLHSFSAGLLTQSVSTGGGQKQKTSATYDSYGQKTSATYDSYGQKTSSTDVNNTTTSYDRSYYTGHHISGITEGSLKQQRFTYLTNERLSITSMNGLAAQHYNYSTGQLSALARKSRVGTGAFTWQSYHFAYDPFGNMTQISVSGADNTATSTPSSAIMLAKYQYESGVNNGRLQKMTFGNDQTVQYSYDKFDRTTKEQYNNVTYVSSAVGGAMSVLPGGGVMRACVEIVGLSYIQTGVDLIFESKIEKTEDPSGRVLIDSAKGGLSKAAEAKSKTITAKIAKSSMGKSKIGKATGAIIGAIGKYFGNIMDLAERSIKHWWRGD